MDPIQEIKRRVAKARAITVLTGAGISADSGIPTFRGEDGLWRNFRAEDLATPEAFARDARLVWEWYDWRRGLIATKAPNDGHRVLAEMERRCNRFTLITQNVDGFHALAGNRNLVELHGNIWKVRCTRCGMVSVNRDVPIRILPYCNADLMRGGPCGNKQKGPPMPPHPALGQAEPDPRLGSCGGLLRPHIVWFGEALDTQDIQKSVAALQSCDVMLVIGTSGVVWPAASFAETAKSAGAFVVEVNPHPSAQSHLMNEVLTGKASEILPGLF
jgi:NAD-dependent deacetylase